MGNTDFKDWSSGWILDGQNISYMREGVTFFEKVVGRDLLHWEYPWHETIVAGTESGPEVPALLEITRGYSETSKLNHIWQLIFGIKGQVYVYVELPTDTHRHGLPKRPKPGSVQWTVSHFEEYMSPFHEPSFLTEHFMMRPDTDRINLSAYNPEATYVRSGMASVILNFFINSMVTERIGTAYYSDTGLTLEPTELVLKDTISSARARKILEEKLEPTRAIMKETLEKMYKHQIPVRPITLLPVRMPAEAPRGE